MADCSIDGCDKATVGRGWCRRHYLRWRKWGDPLNAGTRAPNRTARENLLERVVADGACLIWQGHLTDEGYGQLGVDNEVRYTHRVAYVLAHAGTTDEESIDGLDIDHLCRRRNCVRVNHLEAVTHAENVRRSQLEATAHLSFSAS